MWQISNKIIFLLFLFWYHKIIFFLLKKFMLKVENFIFLIKQSEEIFMQDQLGYFSNSKKSSVNRLKTPKFLAL